MFFSRSRTPCRVDNNTSHSDARKQSPCLTRSTGSSLLDKETKNQQTTITHQSRSPLADNDGTDGIESYCRDTLREHRIHLLA